MTTTDFSNIVIWWFFLSLIGVTFTPIVWLLFKKFTGGGWAFAKTLGTLFLGYTLFFLSTFHILTFSRSSIFLVFIIFLIVNFLIFNKNKQKILKSLSKKVPFIIFEELLFTAGLFFWSYVRSNQPDIRGLEKFMDYGFINSLLHTKYLPPLDMWFAGKPINYYWFGHYLTAFLTKFSAIPSEITYNLMLATILGFCMSGASAFTTTILKFAKKNITKKTLFAAGILSALLLNMGGNFHTPFYVLKDGSSNYWYPDATRFIGYNPDTNDKTIHEFPMYSYTVADLHAHLLNLPVVILYISSLWVLISNRRKKKRIKLLGFLGFLLGIMFMTSTWDFANYGLLTAVVIAFNFYKKSDYKFKSLIPAAINVAIVGVLGLAFAFPFLINFQSIAQGIHLTTTHTPLWQLAILWGFPGIITTIFVYNLFKLSNKVKESDIFIMSMLFTAWCLIALPEIVYVKDIYIASHYRANTMFKLTYQAFVMSYLAAIYVIVRFLKSFETRLAKTIMAFIVGIVLYSIMIYPSYAIKSYYNNLKTYRGLDGISWLKNYYPGEYDTVLWLRKNTNGQPFILEAPGDSYTDFNVISSYTGLPTVSGWFVHEWLWRGTADIPQERVRDISLIYTSTDEAVTKSLLEKYSVSYVIVGHFERQKFPNLVEDKFNKIGKLVFQSNNTSIYQIE